MFCYAKQSREVLVIRFVARQSKTSSSKISIINDDSSFIQHDFQEIKDLVLDSALCYTQQNKQLYQLCISLTEETNALKNVIVDLQKKEEEQAKRIATLCESDAITRACLEAKQKKALKIQERQTQEKKDRMTLKEFQLLLSYTDDKTFKSQRTFVMFTLLYLTRLRAENLAKIKVKQVIELLNTGYTQLKIIKNGPDRDPMVFSPFAKEMFHACKDRIDYITKGKSLIDFTFTPECNPKGECTPYVYKYTLNQHMQKVSTITGKKLSSHSFRISFACDMLETADINQVRKVIGHKSISSTAVYDRVRVPYEILHNDLDNTRKKSLSS